ncbi:MAG: beta-propeller domain-containing protein [Deltaproteobacteria bacterium]|nr:beta-propeller domain-containing protein [Deltaproteobacteria bacterium]
MRTPRIPRIPSNRSILLTTFLTASLLATHRSPAAEARSETSCRTVSTELVAAELANLRAELAPVEPESDSLWDKLLPRQDPRRAQAPAAASTPSAEAAPRSRLKSKSADNSVGKKADLGKAAGARLRTKDEATEGPSSYSRTNTQEQSVDEGDIVKTDGRHVYHVSCSRNGREAGCRNELRIYKTWPADETQLVGRHVVSRDPSAKVEQIYLYGDFIALILPGNDTQYGPDGEASNRSVVRVLLVDVRDPTHPQPARDSTVDGSFVESRLIGSRLYLATTSPALSLPNSLRSDIRQIVQSSDRDLSVESVFDALQPRWARFLHDDPGLPRAHDQLGSAPMYSCRDLHSDRSAQGSSLLNLVQVDLERRDRIVGAATTGYTELSKVYASESSFYVADAAQPTSGWQTSSLIRKFSLERGGAPRFVASGAVRGHLLNQFAMSEHAGNLRVATSDGWASNNLYVLRTQQDRLATVGALENMGVNERIFAVRMMGHRGYVVTFRRTDPLYTLDLSVPERPTVIGELKVEGFSNYLHPLGDDHLLAIGQDADAGGRATGFHMQIFDVGDLRSPRRVHHEKLDAGSTSESQSDHHAFMYEPETKTLALPWRGENFWGLIAYHVDTQSGFRSLGKVNHATMYKRHFEQACRRLDTTECGRPNRWWGLFSREDLTVDRVIAIEGNLYSFSPSGAMVHAVGEKLREQRSVLVNEPAWPGRILNHNAMSRR